MKLINGDSMEILKDFEDNSIDSVVSDPPYGLSQISTQKFNECMIKWCTNDRSFIPSSRGFMGKSWDSFVPPPSLWDEVYRVLKPGGHALIFAGSRTQDLMGLSLRLAGFELRDCVQWIYGSGFPKSLDVSKAIDKIKGEQREVVGQIRRNEGLWSQGEMKTFSITEPSSAEAKEWEGWGTALKPAYEPALLVRKPIEGSVAQNVLKYGVGGINVDGGRIETDDSTLRKGEVREPNKEHLFAMGGIEFSGGHDLGRWPSNIIFKEDSNTQEWARYFYCAKASREERDKGLERFEEFNSGVGALVDGGRAKTKKRNIHPTVKPIDLMRYLCRLITPAGGTVLEPFMGSGTTGIGAIKEGFNFIGIEREKEYFEIAEARIKYWTSMDLSYEDNEVKPTDSQLSLFG